MISVATLPNFMFINDVTTTSSAQNITVTTQNKISYKTYIPDF